MTVVTAHCSSHHSALQVIGLCKKANSIRRISRKGLEADRETNISIPELILPLREYPYFEPHDVEDLNAASVEEARRAATEGVKILSRNGIKVSCDVPTEQDLPWGVIVGEADKWQADMIILGSHGRRGFDRLTMGSVSEAVALHAKCSVEVIRKRMAQPGKSEEGDMQ